MVSLAKRLPWPKNLGSGSAQQMLSSRRWCEQQKTHTHSFPFSFLPLFRMRDDRLSFANTGSGQT